VTLCIAWRDSHGFHMASDSRITVATNSTADVAIKLLRVPCQIYGPSVSGAPELRYDHDIALLFAGSSITSLIVKESLEEVLKLLQAVPGYTRIAFDKIAKICFVAYRQISQQTASTVLAENAHAEIHLAGHCPERNRIRVFRFSTDRRTNEHRQTEVLLQDMGHVLSGSAKELARQQTLNGCSPFAALRHVIDQQLDPAVGGPIQYGTFEGNRFVIRLLAQLDGTQVRYPRGGLNLNDPAFRNEVDDLFISPQLLEA